MEYKDYKTGELITRKQYIANGLERGELLVSEKCGCKVIQDRTAGAYIVYCDRHAELKGMAKTKKQVIAGGYHRPVCPKCNCELRPETNGVGVLDMFRPSDSDTAEPYELWDADKWKCPKCGLEVIGGFGEGAISAHYLADFEAMINHYARHNLLVKNTR